MTLSVENIWKSYEGADLLCGVSFEVAAGEIVCLLGESGSGKSTLLRIIAGLENAEKGRVLWQGEDMGSVPVHQRGFGLMFQDYALFPHRNVAENVAFGPRMQHLSKEEIDRRVHAELERVNLLEFARRRVTELSGGEQQRVALARALAARPRLLMLDEPLGALDRSLREQLMHDLRRILHDARIPAIYVTHDQEEAFTLADRIILLHDGVILQSGTPPQIYQSPTSEWAARFLGLVNLITGRVTGLDPLQVQTTAGGFKAICERHQHRLGDEIHLVLRPSGAIITGGDDQEENNHLCGVVQDVVFRGDRYRASFQVNGGNSFEFDVDHAPAVGQELSLILPPEAVRCLG